MAKMLTNPLCESGERCTKDAASSNRSTSTGVGGLRTALLCLFLIAEMAVHGHAEVCGDADGDGNVTDTDGVQTLRAAAALPSKCKLATCDMDSNGTISDTDGVIVLRKAAQLPIAENSCGMLSSCEPQDYVASASPQRLALDPAGNLFVGEGNTRLVRRVDFATGTITTIAGNGDSGPPGSGDGGLALEANLYPNPAVAVDSTGATYIAETDAYRVRRVDPVTGIISTVIGTGLSGFSGDGGPAAEAQLKYPWQISLDRADNLFIADWGNFRIRRVDAATATITTVAGDGRDFATGNGGPAIFAGLEIPWDVAVDRTESIYIVDFHGNSIPRVDAQGGIIDVFAGNGIYGHEGDGGPATDARLTHPTAIALDAAANLFIAEDTSRVRRVDSTTHIITTAVEYAPPGEHQFSPNYRALAIDDARRMLYLADYG